MKVTLSKKTLAREWLYFLGAFAVGFIYTPLVYYADVVGWQDTRNPQGVLASQTDSLVKRQLLLERAKAKLRQEQDLEKWERYRVDKPDSVSAETARVKGKKLIPVTDPQRLAVLEGKQDSVITDPDAYLLSNGYSRVRVSAVEQFVGDFFSTRVLRAILLPYVALLFLRSIFSSIKVLRRKD